MLQTFKNGWKRRQSQVLLHQTLMEGQVSCKEQGCNLEYNALIVVSNHATMRFHTPQSVLGVHCIVFLCVHKLVLITVTMLHWTVWVHTPWWPGSHGTVYVSKHYDPSLSVFACRYKRVFSIGTTAVTTYNPNTHEVTNQVRG